MRKQGSKRELWVHKTAATEYQPGDPTRIHVFQELLNFGLSPEALGRIGMMPRLLTADDIMALIASLTDSERIRLLRWIASPSGSDASSYGAAPPTGDEFSGEEDRDGDPIAWESDGWEEFR